MPNSKINLLLVEDNPGDVKTIQAYLAQAANAQYGLFKAETIREALETLQQEKIDAILLELTVPDSNGVKAIERIFFKHRDIPIIVLTGAQDEKLGMSAVEAGAQDYLLKDQMSGPLILNAVRYAMERNRIRLSHSQAEERFLKIFRSNPLPICISALADGRILDVNDRFCEFFGYFRDEMLGKTAAALNLYVNPQARDAVLAGLKKDGHLHNFEVAFQNRDGEVRNVLLSNEIVTLGEEPVFIKMITDITELRQVEEKLRLLASIVENSEDAIYSRDIIGRIQSWNSGAEKLFGYTKEEMIGEHVQKLVPPERENEFVAIIEKLSEGLSLENFETERMHKDGRRIPVSLSVSQIKDANGNFIGASIIARDMTVYKQATKELRDSEERFRQMAENIREVFWMTDVEKNKIIYISPGYEQIWGRSCESLYQNPQNWADCISPDDRTRVLKSAMCNQANGTYNEEYKIIRPDGSIRWIWDRAFPVKDATGTAFRVVGIAEDITDRKMLQDQFRQAQKMEAVGRLAGGVAHDFNNILNIIIGYSDMLGAASPDAPTWKDDVEEVRKAAKRAASLTHQLLAFSRQQAMQPRVLDLNSEIEDLTKMLSRLMGEDVRWDSSLAPDLWHVRADPSQIQQVMINLAVNSRDAMPNGGSFSIKTRNSTFFEHSSQSLVPPGEYVTLIVSDTGIGMNEETKTRAFEPFYTTKEKGKGTGLGLSLVYGVVKQSNGYIFIDSEEGKGTTFTMHFPKTQEPLKKDLGAKDTLRLGGKAETILVIEDELAVRRLVSRVLNKNGFNVLSAASAKEALSIVELEGAKLTMLLTDIVLPDVRGDEIAKKILSVYPTLKVLYMSGYAGKDFGELNIDEEVAMLAKPFSPDELTQKVRSILDGR